MKPCNLPIGIFDSGLGGLTVVKAVREMMPGEDIVYLGDTARLPYGTKSKEQIKNFSLNNVRFLLSKGVKAIVIACNSSSANAYSIIKRSINIPVADVITPAVKSVCCGGKGKKILVLGTSATINSGAYEKKIKKSCGNFIVYSKSCPLFVPIVEEGELNSEITELIVKKYLSDYARRGITDILLGCTHYPLLAGAIKKVMPNADIVDSGKSTASALRSILYGKGLSAKPENCGKLAVYLTDFSPNFKMLAERFLGYKVGRIRKVNL